jgi:predicted  nucleic acid-binding Zn-ribbon protein
MELTSLKELKWQYHQVESDLKELNEKFEDLEAYVDDVEMELKKVLKNCTTVEEYREKIEELLNMDD